MEVQFSSPTSRPEDGLYLPENAGWFTRLRVAVRALRVLEKQPDDSVAAPLLTASLDGDTFAKLVAELENTAEGRLLLRDRPSLQKGTIDLDVLQALPRDTLGHAFARYYADNGIAPFESPYVVRNDVDFAVKRFRETHDLVHVVTGYGTDALGEMELQAFLVGNLGLRTSILILTFAALLRPHGLPPIWKYTDKLKRAYRRGRESEKVVRHHYERFWEITLEDARRLLGIPPLAAA